MLPRKLESREDVSIYNCQRVLRKTGYNQGVVRSIGDMSYSNSLMVENKFAGEGRVGISRWAERLFCLELAVKGLYLQEEFYYGQRV